jgi:hypothetical protein
MHPKMHLFFAGIKRAVSHPQYAPEKRGPDRSFMHPFLHLVVHLRLERIG